MSEKFCDACEKTIGDTDEICPACGVNQKELDEEISVVERATKASANRRKRTNPEPSHAPASEGQTRKSIFRSLARLKGSK
jgi:RNA polymerase subunit RPABC4/transcription elongation factor Spt4